VIARDRATSEGGMTDIRVGAAYRFSDRIALGIGGHVVTGENQLFLSRTFVDAPGFGSFSQTTVVDYFGTAVSAGVLLAPTGNLTIGASAQLGSDLDARQRDT